MSQMPQLPDPTPQEDDAGQGTGFYQIVVLFAMVIAIAALVIVGGQPPA